MHRLHDLPQFLITTDGVTSFLSCSSVTVVVFRFQNGYGLQRSALPFREDRAIAQAVCGSLPTNTDGFQPSSGHMGFVVDKGH
jgi:hypothetical protein